MTPDTNDFRIGDLHHVSVLVADLQRSLDFYCGLLGMQVDNTRPEMSYEGAWLVAGAGQVHLLQLPNPDSHDRPVHVGRDRHMAFRVTGLALIKCRLEESGVVYTESRSGRCAIFFRDPDDNGIELVEDVASAG